MVSVADSTPEFAQRREAPARAVVEVHGGPGRATVAGLAELWRFRDVLGAFAVRSVKVRYKQAAIGIGWAVLQPVVSALLFTVFLGRLVKIGSENLPYVLFALAGTVCWNYFSTTLTGANESLITDQAMLRKVYFPREVLPLAAVLAGLVDFVPALATLGVAALVEGYMPALTWLALPLPLLLLALPALGIGLALASLNVYYRDVRYVLPFFVQLGLFASPVVFSAAKVPAPWRTFYLALDPPASAIDTMRRALLHHTWPQATSLAALAVSLLLIALGYLLFKRLERGFADRI